MNALETNRYTEAWRLFGQTVPRPRAILAVSAHWFVNASAVTAMSRPRTIHDFYGFPEPLFQVQYPAPGSRELAEEVAELAKPVHVGLDEDSWGLDHGTWSVLVHAFPGADIPVVQLALHALQGFDFHQELAAKLAPLRDRGVLILGSGNLVHNLRAMNWSQPELGFDWAMRFGDSARAILEARPTELPSLVNHPDFRMAVPTPDHFLPLLYLTGLAGAEGSPVQTLIDGYTYGAISMASFVLGATPPKSTGVKAAAAALPNPGVVPPEDTNL